MRSRLTVFVRATASLVCAGALLCSVGCSTNPPAQRFQSHVNYLASDRLEGRGVGSKGIELAADYIATQFQRVGLEAGAADGTYFQEFPVSVRRTLTDDASLTVAGETQPRELYRDFVPFSFSSADPFDGGAVFCGYGIESADRDHNDYKGIDLAGRVAIMLRGEPADWADDKGNPTRHAMFRDKVYDAKDRGAVAVLIANTAPQGPDETDELLPLDAASRENFGIPAFHIKRAFAQALLARGGVGSLDELQQRLDKGAFVSAELAHVSLEGNPGLRQETTPTRNVVGLLRGEGPFADECVVIGAHYDHLGIAKPMLRRFKAGKLVREELEPEIHNGADDNASGVAGLIEIAREAVAGPRPKRTLLFIAFSAEESGLLGSTHYVKEPICSLDNTVAMLNMDMIGRMEPGGDRVLVFGANSGTGIEDALMRYASRHGLTVEPSKDSGGRSDHAPFIRHEIPSLHFLTGIHPDYHKPSDDADKINAPGGVKVARLVHDVAVEVANADTRPAFQAVRIESRTSAASAGTPTFRVVMGLAPGYAEGDEPGMAVEAVTPDGPADLAGMKGGDRIVRIDGKDVANIYDYMAALRKNQPGDQVEVVVLRDRAEVKLTVTLSAAR